MLQKIKRVLTCLREFQQEIKRCFSGINDLNQMKSKTMKQIIQDNRNEEMGFDAYDIIDGGKESIETGFIEFSKEWSEIKSLFRSEPHHIKFKFECQDLDLLDMIEQLDKDTGAMMNYILYVARDTGEKGDLQEVVMASAVSSLLNIQNALIEQFYSIINLQRANKSTVIRKNFLKCSDYNFIDMNLNVSSR
jgi:hypothetical protein